MALKDLQGKRFILIFGKNIDGGGYFANYGIAALGYNPSSDFAEIWVVNNISMGYYPRAIAKELIAISGSDEQVQINLESVVTVIGTYIADSYKIIVF